ncbi:hypothetical protein, partial [Actinomyces graevenitzii]|uniref:hypothetical protein n=1 Tax=Actinomyces graevenitzii TaxID=55565 RepID=UPI0018C8C5C8
GAAHRLAAAHAGPHGQPDGDGAAHWHGVAHGSADCQPNWCTHGHGGAHCGSHQPALASSHGGPHRHADNSWPAHHLAAAHRRPNGVVGPWTTHCRARPTHYQPNGVNPPHCGPRAAGQAKHSTGA